MKEAVVQLPCKGSSGVPGLDKITIERGKILKLFA